MRFITRGLKEMMIVGLAIIAALALMLPSFIPDFLPLVGKVDEAFWTLILINTAGYYGLNLSSLYGDSKPRKVIRRVKKRKPSGTPSAFIADDNKRMIIHDGTSETPIIEEK
ncbi:MAG TPA: hypothetical protein PLZ51_13110 [Aggregatilineales bacterium]|nr:hypothetical protein [Aggregatilineales bacterium]